MRVGLILCFVPGLFFSSNSQEYNKVYYEKNWIMNSIDYATYYRVSDFLIAPLSYDGNITDYYIANDQIEMTGQYRNGIKEGEFLFYYHNGSIRLHIQFENNLRTGRWVEYYENGKVKIDVLYVDKMEKILSFNDSLGNSKLDESSFKYSILHYDVPENDFYVEHIDSDDYIEIKGKVADHYREGKWVVKKNGVLYAELKYKNGKLIKGFVQLDRNKVDLDTYYSDVFPLINTPKKFYMTENFVQKPGAVIKNNYVTNGLYLYKLNKMKKAEIDSEEELIKYITSKFDLRTNNEERTIVINISVIGSLPQVASIKPKIGNKSMESLTQILQTIKKLNFKSDEVISFEYLIEHFDEE